MKKWKKQIVAWGAVASLGLGFVAPVANAQTYDAAFFAELSEKNQSFKNAKVEGTIKATVSSDGQTIDLGTIDASVAFNTEPVSFAFTATVKSLFLGGQDFEVASYLQDNVAYFGTPVEEEGKLVTSWMAVDATGVDETFNETTSPETLDKYVDMDKVNEINAKYSDVTETETDYVISLKENIDADAFVEDIRSAIDLDGIRAEAIRQYEEQKGEPLTEEEKASFEDYNVEDYIATIKVLLASNPKVTLMYDKASGFLKAVDMDIKVNVKEVLAAADQNVDGLPLEMIHIVLNYTISGHNETQTWEVPAEALAAPVQSSDSEVE